MKKVILSTFLVAAMMQAKAQVITDTVSIGASYANQVWYSLANDEQGSAPKANWDLAFDVTGYGSTVAINSVTGTTLWKYPGADTSGWSTLDTTGLSLWTSHWNSDTSWSLGAMGNYVDASNPFDLDWGLYNLTTHVVTGDSLYIIKLADGSYKKLWIESLSGSVYTFKYANLDGTSPQSDTLDKATYTGKNYGYYSLQSHAALDREPLTANWDLVFTQYTAFIPIPYTVTGVLSNAGVQVARLSGIADVDTYSVYSTATYSTAINTIGYDWKTYTGTYVTVDSLLYFVKPASGDVWKVIFTGFGGSTTGDYIFSKEKLSTTTTPPPTGVANVNGTPAVSLAMYPNPASNQAVTVVYSFENNVTSAILTVTDIDGRTVLTSNLNNAAGLHQYHIPVQSLLPGMYIVNVVTGGGSVQQKLIVQ